jgi:Malonyl-CoA decarboxylase C-terminal domain
MIQLIKDLSNSLLEYIKDDPVRPNLSVDFRVSEGRVVLALVEDGKPTAMVCVSLHDFIPGSVEDLAETASAPTAAIFYTIWSYKPGSGRELLENAVSELKKEYPSLERFVTLSPKTEMARRFHHKNGAVTFRENTETVNYEYHV